MNQNDKQLSDYSKTEASERTTGRALYLTTKQTKFLFFYYFIVLLAAFTSACGVFVPGPFSKFDYLELSLIGASSMACLGSSVYYTRKLYKSVLSNFLITNQSSEELKTYATFVYFFARPLFSLAFALLIVIGIKSGLVLSGAHQGELTYGFVQLTMFFSFFVGFLSGRFLRQLEAWGERMLDRVSAEQSK